MRNVIKVILFISSLAITASATTRYVAQSAGSFSGGTACNGHTAITPATFNGTTLAAGDITYLCGTITASANTTLLTISQSGTAGNLISIVFDTGAVLTAPYWGVTGAITASNASYLLIDGGTNGTITSTANGTGLSNVCTTGTNCSAVGTYFSNVDHSEIKNLTISNIYVHTCTQPLVNCTDDNSNQFTHGISWIGGSNATIDHNTIHDAFSGIQYTYPGSATTSNITINNNTLYNDNWDMNIGSGGTNGIVSGLSIHDNVMHDWNNWGTDNNAYHHDGVFVFTAASGQSMTGVQVYNNLLYGGLDAISGFIYLEDDGAGRPITNAYVFNNVVYVTVVPSSGIYSAMFDWSTGLHLFNNTFVYPASPGSGATMDLVYGTGSTIRNNIFATCQYGFTVNTSGPATITSSDYNDVYGCSTVGVYHGNFETTLANWQSFTGLDAHSISANPNLNASSSPPYQLTSSSSPAYHTGANLTSYCSTAPALCLDATGTVRPSTGPWDMGAYQLVAGTQPPNPPTNLQSVVH